MSTPNRAITYVPENVTDIAAATNQALDEIDAKFVPIVISMALATPPGSPANGDMYVVAASPTGAWAGWTGRVVRYRTTGAYWQSYDQTEVALVLNQATGKLYACDFSSPGGWSIVGATEPAPIVTDSTTNLSATPLNSGNYTRFTNTGAVEYLFSDAEDFVIGAEYHGRYLGAGTLEIAEGGTMVVNPPADGTLFIPPQGTFTVKIVSASVADLFGVTVPV